MLQKEKVGEAVTPGKSAARTLSCADALYKLYEKNDVIRVSMIKHNIDHGTLWKNDPQNFLVNTKFFNLKESDESGKS